MSAKEAKAASVSPPGEVYARNGATAGEVFKLPKKFRRQYLTVQAEGQDAYAFVKVAKTAPAVPDQSARSTVDGSNEIAAAANGGVHVPAGQERHFDLEELEPEIKADGDRIWLGHDAAVAGGVVRFWKSSGPKGE